MHHSFEDGEYVFVSAFVVAVYGGGEEGVKLYIDKLGAELKDAMQMCGAHSVSEITRDMVRYYQD